MSEFSYLNPKIELVLKIIAQKPVSPENIAFVLDLEKSKIGEIWQLLLQKEYIKNTNGKNSRTDILYPNDKYRITVNGENYLYNLENTRDKAIWQRRINIYTSVGTTIALLKGFWNEIISTVQQLMQWWQG